MIRQTIDNAANSTLSNLTENGKNLSSWSSNVSNCLTEIPQNIKLELNNGTLTLKAGSKLFICDGNFTPVTVTVDRSATASDSGYKIVVASVNSVSGLVDTIAVSAQSGFLSGSDVSGAATGSYYFNEIDKKIYVNIGGVWVERTTRCLPLGIVYVENGAISEIVHVFNGFGYMGNTVFCLPNLSCNIANGRNSDGTLKSIKIKTNDVLIYTYDQGNGYFYVLLFDNLDLQTQAAYKVDFDKKNNFVLLNGIKSNAVILGRVYFASNIIQRIDKRDVISITESNSENPDYNNGIVLSAGSLPYTCPTDGFIDLSIYALNGTNKLIINLYDACEVTSTNASYYSNLTGQFKVSEGDLIRIDDTSKIQMIKFYPMKGA